MPSSEGYKNLIPAAASKTKARRDIGPGTDTYAHMKFVVWAMQQVSIDAITVRRVKDVMKVSTATAQRLRHMWRNLTATRFYHDSVPDVVTALTCAYRLSSARVVDDIHKCIKNLPEGASDDE